MKGRDIPYSADEIAWLEANRTLVIGEYHRLFNQQFGRDVSAANLHALRKRKGWKTGRTGCFEAGSEPHNKGLPCALGTGGLHPNSRKTQFRAGCRTGKAALNYKPVGTERVTDEGYRERKVNDDLPFKHRWRPVHRIEWEAANGPVPKGMALKCKGDVLDTNPENWQLVSRSILPRLNGGRRKKYVAYDDAPDELKPVIMAVAKLDHSTRVARRASTMTPAQKPDRALTRGDEDV